MSEAPCSRSWIETWVSDPERRAFHFHCPECGSLHQFHLHRPHPFPTALPLQCDACGHLVTVELTHWRPNPSGEGPAPPALLQHTLSYLQKCLLKSDNQRTRPASPRPQLQQRQQPCPTGVERLHLADWVARGLVSAAIAPTTVAKGYRWVFGVSPRQRRQANVYSEREVLMALRALGVNAAA